MSSTIETFHEPATTHNNFADIGLENLHQEKNFEIILSYSWPVCLQANLELTADSRNQTRLAAESRMTINFVGENLQCQSS